MSTYKYPMLPTSEPLDIDHFMLTLTEIGAMAEPVDLIPGFVASDLTAVIGRPFCGKTWLVLHMVAALVLGRPFLGRAPAPVEAGHRVAFFTTDPGSAKQVRRRLHALGVDDSYTDRFAIFAKGIRLGERGASSVIRSLETFRPTVVLIDNLGGSIPSDADINSSSGVGPTMEVVRQLAERWPTILVAHTSKPGMGNGPKGGTTAMGATKIDGDARRTVLIEVGGKGGSDPYRDITITSNDAPGETLAIELAGPNLTIVDARKQPTKKAEQERQVANEAQEVAEFLMDHAESIKTKADAARVIESGRASQVVGNTYDARRKWLSRHVFGSKGHKLLALHDGVLTRGPDWPDQ